MRTNMKADPCLGGGVFKPTAIAIAFVFAVAVGIGFGLFPAMKAGKLAPVEVLR